MVFSLVDLKKRAAEEGAQLLVLHPNGKLPGSLRGKSGEKLWLCMPRDMERKLVYAAACRFDDVRIFTKAES